MFDIFFGWRKASKCKMLIKRVQCRLKLLKTKRNSIVKQLREDMAQLLKLGYEESAFNRAEQLFTDENILAVYNILDHFCEFVYTQLPYIRRNKDCPNDINEAVSSLIYASARCADLPELPAIRKLFGERYGQRFATAAVEVLPGNLVNREIIEKLSTKSVSDDLKYRLLDEIGRDYCLQPEVLAIEYIPEIQQQVEQMSGDQEPDRNNCKTEGSRSPRMQSSDADEMEARSILVDHVKMSANLSIRESQSHSYPNSDATSCTSLGSSQRLSPNKMEQIKTEKKWEIRQTHSSFQLTGDTLGDGHGQGQSNNICPIYATDTLKDKDEILTVPSSSESSPQQIVVYVDDIEELESSMTKGEFQDQRLFKFKSPILPKGSVVVDVYNKSDESNMDHDVQDENSSSSSSSSSRTCSSKSRNSIGKRSRRRSFPLQSSSMKDTDHELYYEKPGIGKTSPKLGHKSYHYKKLQKTTEIAESKEPTYLLKRLKQPCRIALGGNFQPTRSCCHCHCHFNSEVNGQNSCYSCNGNDKEEQFRARNQKTWLRNSGQLPEEMLDAKFRHYQCCSNGASNEETGCTSLTENQSYDNGLAGTHVSYNSFLLSVATTASNCMTSKERVASASPNYLRAMTMPQERPKENQRYSILRFNSLSSHNPNHVHPKLPEYDDIAAKFRALKKDHLLHKL